MNKKLLIFDIDGTLCDINNAIDTSLVEVLQAISKQHQVVLASGKPFGYIAGLIRQIQLNDCMVIGENGGTIMFSSTFPPKGYHQVDIPEKIRSLFIDMKNKYSQAFGRSVWFQPNDVNLTVFPIDINDVQKVYEFAQQFQEEDIDTYYHKDSVDFVPKGFDKGTAVEFLLEKLNFEKEDLYVFGDGENDLSMLAKTNNSIIVRGKINDFRPKFFIKSYADLRRFLMEEFCNQKR